MKSFLLSLSILLEAASAASIPRGSSAPSVTIKNGTVVGQSDGKIDNFLGIPYAQPPVGHLRLKLPQTIARSFGTLKLPTVPTSCPQMNLSSIDSTGFPKRTKDIVDSFGANYTGPQGEDCLTINVQRPAGVPANAKLPVLFWIYGGGWEIGNTAMYDGSVLVNKSLERGEPIVFVAVNYRVNAFGFLAGKQLQKEGSTNLGLHDQRLGLQWAAENVGAFGGDPDRVTIWGESAGAASVYDHLLIDGGDNTYKGKPLFHGAIMNSGSIIRSESADSAKAQDVFDRFSLAAGCGPSNITDVLGCLRTVPYKKYFDAMNSLPNFNQYSSNNLAYIRRPDSSSRFYPASPEVLSAKGAFARVPVIIGDQEDEGTLFALQQRNLTTTNDLVDFFQSWYPNTPRKHVAELVSTYPDNPAAGSPFRTGDKYNFYPQFKRNAAIQGDLCFTLERRETLGYLEPYLPTWSYLSTYGHDLPVLGTYHTLDLDTNFGLQNYPQAGITADSYFISFVNHLDPNGKGLKQWPKWDKQGRQMINISATDVSYLKDDFRSNSYNVLKKYATEFRM